MVDDYSYLKPGQILLFKKKEGFDIWGSIITAEERDTDVCHAAMVGHFGKIWSTGVLKRFGMSMFFGVTDAETYLKGRSFYVCEHSMLVGWRLSSIYTTAWTLYGQMYGMWKVILLTQKAKFGGIVRRLYPWLTRTVKNPFCSEAIAYCYWQAGLRICEEMGKEEPSAITPANIKDYAQMKGTPLNIIKEVNQ